MTTSDEVDVLAEFQNGYDGVLESLVVTADAARNGVTARLAMRVVTVVGEVGRWSRVEVVFDVLDRFVVDSTWFAGGGLVLYDGARVVVGPGDALRVDLDPGTAWLTTGAMPKASDFLLVGRGRVVIVPI